uniref:zinc finger protein 2 homolog n=1 Tax=Maylandia zebra TaxID=106582 RepID=UPI000D30C292|nr:zinc finger protein 2 homolog [Maylandia zebra]
MDPADSSAFEFNTEMVRMIKLLGRIAQANDLRTMAVRLSAIDAIIWSNPRLTQLSTDTVLGSSIAAWREQVRAGELALSTSTSLPPLQDNTHSPPASLLPQTSSPSSCRPGPCSPVHSPAFFLAAMWSEDEEEVSTFLHRFLFPHLEGSDATVTPLLGHPSSNQPPLEGQRSQEADKPHRRKGEKKYSCDECGKNFTHLGNFKAHQLVHSGDKPYRCDLCGKRFTQKGHLKSHQLIHSGVKPYSCELCGKSFTHPASLKTHQVIHGGVKPYSCDLCGKSFNDPADLKKHQLIHSGVKVYIDDPVKAEPPVEKEEKCVSDSLLPATPDLSIEDQHGVRSQRSQEADKPHRRKGEKKYSCDECGKNFTHLGNFKAHQLVHSGDKPYRCDLCGKRFTQKGHLKSHQRIHSGVKPYSCELCGKSFTHPASLKTHQVIHGGVKPYSCELCGKSFTHSASLKTHQVIHSGVKPYSCELCGKAFTCSGNLQRHQLIHSGIKAYSCGQCGKAFARSSTLQRHQVTHSGFKPYSCDLCGKSFNDPADLKKHQLIHSGVKVYIDDPVKAEPPVEKEEKCVSDSLLPATPDLSIEASKADFVHVQQNDPTLAKCLLAVNSNEQTPMFTALATTC